MLQLPVLPPGCSQSPHGAGVPIPTLIWVQVQEMPAACWLPVQQCYGACPGSAGSQAVQKLLDGVGDKWPLLLVAAQHCLLQPPRPQAWAALQLLSAVTASPLGSLGAGSR